MEIAVTVIGTLLVVSQGFVWRSLQRLEDKFDAAIEKIASVGKALAVHVERGH